MTPRWLWLWCLATLLGLRPAAAAATTLRVRFNVWPVDAEVWIFDNRGQWIDLGTATAPVQWNTEWSDRERNVQFRLGGQTFSDSVQPHYFSPERVTWPLQGARTLPVSSGLYWQYMAPRVALAGVGAVVLLAVGAWWWRRRPAALPPADGDMLDPWIGRTLGGYRLLDRLGEGGMATVYRARKGQGEVVALKLMRQGLATNAEFRARFQREVRVLARLSHPSIVRVYDYTGADESVLYFTMELVSGTSLRDQLPALRGRPQDMLQVLRPIFAGVAYAHHQGVVHRDLKPENVMLVAQGGVKVMDFGMARASTDTVLTQTGSLLGTPRYFPPESLITSGSELDPRSDQYSLGVMVYEIPGRTPFVSDDLVTLVMQHQTALPPPLREVAPEMTPALEAVVGRMIRKSPETRYDTLDEAFAALEAALLELV